MDRDGSI